jgi:hypothetical protein
MSREPLALISVSRCGFLDSVLSRPGIPFQPSHRSRKNMPSPPRSLEAAGFHNVYVLTRIKKTEILMQTISSRTTRFNARAATAQHGPRFAGPTLAGPKLGDLLAGVAFVAAIAFATAIIFGFVG